MKLVKQKYTIIEQKPGLEGAYKQAEIGGRVCYKSEDRITDKSYEKFISLIKDKEHLSVLEHGTVYLSVPESGADLVDKYIHNKYSVVIPGATAPQDNEDKFYCHITTNLRVIIENGWQDDLKYQVEPTDKHRRRYTVHFTTDRRTAESFIRHRVFSKDADALEMFNHSYSQESTRYCNYSKSKFGNSIQIIEPVWTNIGSLECTADILDEDDGFEKLIDDFGKPNAIMLSSFMVAEKSYFELLKEGWTPERARVVLPFEVKTELVMTGFESDWQHFFKLRTDKTAHHQARALVTPLEKAFKKKGYL